MSKTFPEKILRKSTKISKSVFLYFFLVLLRLKVLLSDGSSKTQQQTVYKQIVSKSFYKKIDKKPLRPCCWPALQHSQLTPALESHQGTDYQLARTVPLRK
jgi:hypothetical protein